ncbi:MAG: RNase adapter RapZ [Clostridiales bacterium]|nr:RNase adapter RapZ [Clostridiales bacterium]
MELIFLTGMSGAGKSQAADFLEDQGFFCIDNLPPMILPELVKSFYKGQGGDGFGIDKLVFVVDIRSREFLKGFGAALKKIDEEIGCAYRIIFLEASDDVLVKRYRQSRRKHPLGKDLSLTDAISSERKLLLGIRARATNVIDTSMMALPALRDELLSMIEDDASTGMSVFIESFGFKYGMPVDCDNVLDVRFLPNPFYIPELKMMSGLDQGIGEYLEGFEETKTYKEKIMDLLKFTIPLYIKEGKGRLHIGIGCTGGRHRSVYIAEYLSRSLSEAGYKTITHHRDIDKDPRYIKKDEQN